MEERAERSRNDVSSLPMVPLRDIVVFPHTMVPFVVGRKPSLLAVERALAAHEDSAAWRRLQMRGMTQDFSWDHSAGLYRQMYERALALRWETESAGADGGQP